MALGWPYAFVARFSQVSCSVCVISTSVHVPPEAVPVPAGVQQQSRRDLFLPTHADKRGPHPEPGHDSTNPLLVQLPGHWGEHGYHGDGGGDDVSGDDDDDGDDEEDNDVHSVQVGYVVYNEDGGNDNDNDNGDGDDDVSDGEQ